MVLFELSYSCLNLKEEDPIFVCKILRSLISVNA